MFVFPVVPCCDVLGVVCLNLTILKLEATTPNMSQQGSQTQVMCKQCCTQPCCDRLAGALIIDNVLYKSHISRQLRNLIGNEQRIALILD